MLVVGKEQIENLKHGSEYIRYTYHHMDGIVYYCIHPTLEECRKSRNHWIKDNCLLFNNQIVFKQETNEKLIVFNVNMKGYVVLIHDRTAKLEMIQRNSFFLKYDLFNQNQLGGILDEDKVYGLIMKSYHLNFSTKKNKTDLNYE